MMVQIRQYLLGGTFLQPLILCVKDLGPNMVTLNGAGQDRGSGSDCCLCTSTLQTVLQLLLWNFFSFPSYTCNSWPQIQPHILHGSYYICPHWTTQMH